MKIGIDVGGVVIAIGLLALAVLAAVAAVAFDCGDAARAVFIALALVYAFGAGLNLGRDGR